MTYAEVRMVRKLAEDLEFAYASEDDERIEQIEQELDYHRQYDERGMVAFLQRMSFGTVPGEFVSSGVVEWQPIASLR